jgi:hypothetical protein
MVDLLVEDIVEVTETLLVADEVDIEALAHQNPLHNLHERLHAKAKRGGLGKWGKQKAAQFRAKMKEQQHGAGVFKRAAC